MSGLIRFGDGRSWSAASWIFDQVMRLMAPHIIGTYPVLVHNMTQSWYTGRHLDLRELSAGELAAFRAAAVIAYQDAHLKGAEAVERPELYKAFMLRFGQLRHALAGACR